MIQQFGMGHELFQRAGMGGGFEGKLAAHIQQDIAAQRLAKRSVGGRLLKIRRCGERAQLILVFARHQAAHSIVEKHQGGAFCFFGKHGNLAPLHRSSPIIACLQNEHHHRLHTQQTGRAGRCPLGGQGKT